MPLLSEVSAPLAAARTRTGMLALNRCWTWRRRDDDYQWSICSTTLGLSLRLGRHWHIVCVSGLGTGTGGGSCPTGRPVRSSIKWAMHVHKREILFAFFSAIGNATAELGATGRATGTGSVRGVLRFHGA